MATKMSLTKEQSLAVTTRGKVMVSASAGSGKTHTMLERIMYLIENGVSLRKMLILVYNEANASELREKIRQKLFEKVCEQVGETADKYRKQLDEIAFSTICTIHAFCRSAIRKNFEAARAAGEVRQGRDGCRQSLRRTHQSDDSHQGAV